MILQSLHALYDRLQNDPDYGVAEPNHSRQKITFRVVIREDGTLHEVQDVRVREGKTTRPQQIQVPGYGKPSGAGLNPCFLWDNSGYMLGFKPDDPKPERSLKAFEAFRKKHLELEAEIDDPGYSAVCRFLKSWDPERASDYPVLRETSTGFGLFQLLGESQYVHQRPAVRAWWGSQSDKKGGEMGQCLLSGETSRLARLHPKIKGVAGGKSEALLVSFNEAAYTSYGKEQSFNAPVSEAAAEQYGAALNALLDGPKRQRHRLTLADDTLVFWTERPTATEDLFAQFLSEGSSSVEKEEVQDEGLREKLKVFLEALREGREAYADLEKDPDSTAFYLLSLSPNAARLSVRFFLRSTLGDLFDHLRSHHDSIRIVPRRDKNGLPVETEVPPVWRLLRETARESKDIPPMLAAPFLRSILTGCPYPMALYSAVIRRIRADREINYYRACIIKGMLIRNYKTEVTMSLDTERKDTAYLLGRLFAALEKTQGDALGQLNASIRDRFYSAASATPGTVFPRLLRTYQHHLAKLEGGYKINREKLVQAIVEPLEVFPSRLDLRDQGLFAIGYYHQTRDFYRKRDGGTAEPVEGSVVPPGKGE